MLLLVPATTEPTTPAPDENGIVSSLADVISTVWSNLGDNGYQTGLALIVATVAIVAMVNLKSPLWVIIPVTIGAFWIGWLGYNTLTNNDNALFPSDIEATRLWDVAFASDTGFLLFVAVACVAMVLLWRKGTPLASRIWLVLGFVAGASFFYNLFEAVRTA